MERSHQSFKGAAMVEFAMIFPLFISVLFVAIQLSLILVDKASIDYVTEEMLLERATGEDGPSETDPYLAPEWRQRLSNSRVNSTNPTITPHICYPADDKLVSLRNFDYPELTPTPRDTPGAAVSGNIALLKFEVSAKINCALDLATFGLTQGLGLCEHTKNYYRIVSIVFGDYGVCPEDF